MRIDHFVKLDEFIVILIYYTNFCLLSEFQHDYSEH